MKSKTKISKQAKRKTNSNVVQTILLAKKKKNWLEIAAILSGPRRKQIQFNLDNIGENSKEGDTIVIPGKVLSRGSVSKKIKLVALNFSESAKEKLLNSKCDVGLLLDEIKKNPEAKGVKILK